MKVITFLLILSYSAFDGLREVKSQVKPKKGWKNPPASS